MSTFEPPFPQCDVAFDDPVAALRVNQLLTDSEQRLLYLQRKFELIENTTFLNCQTIASFKCNFSSAEETRNTIFTARKLCFGCSHRCLSVKGVGYPGHWKGYMGEVTC